ncbi:hypothetical protein M427DRAFT_344081 [Gonapodya prolifera JEL478]|uniref:Amino acid transporter transmembrane domain-containing protein n=1 Tax=Gonapodya prolifera (strain JEL478) TaxID=1344416 RepID=A0A139AVK2_GONPJ|nr:hypothetical protein M427DRAFT_344081 [Gonapodya prolifera JEL478]|eukprot:KXS20747.1 hypothetical protein M427DRAFT_344081 [Gonapodya prolifera JEL478]
MGASVLSSVLNLTKSLTAAPLLSIPYSFLLLTPHLATCVILLLAVATSFTLKASVRASRRLIGDTGAVNWAGVARAAVGGTRWKYYRGGGEGKGGGEMDVVDLVVGVLTFGAASGYLIAISDSMSRAAAVVPLAPELQKWAIDRKAWILVCALIVIPLSMPRHLHSLRFSSLLGNLAVAYVVCMVVAWWVVNGPQAGSLRDFGVLRSVRDTRDHNWSAAVEAATQGWRDLAASDLDKWVYGFYAVSLIVNLMSCHQIIYTVYNELQDHSPVRMGLVIDASVALSTGIYLLVGWFGWLTWREKVVGDVLNNSLSWHELPFPYPSSLHMQFNYTHAVPQ